MAKITYDNKTNIRTYPTLPNANKVTDNDMNEIKSVVNDNYDEFIDEIFYKSGDEIELGANGGYIINGFLSNSSQDVFFVVPVPKRLDNITSLTLDNLNVRIRGIGGYLNNQSNYVEYTTTAGYSFGIGIASDNAIRIGMSKSSAFSNATNNTPVSIQGYIKITLQ